MENSTLSVSLLWRNDSFLRKMTLILFKEVTYILEKDEVV